MGAHSSKHGINNGGLNGTTKLRNPCGNTGITGGSSMLLPSLLRRRKTRKDEKYHMDATTSRFFLGDAATSISVCSSTDSIGTTISDQGDDPKNTVSPKSTLSSRASSSGGSSDTSSGSNEHDHSQNDGDPFPPKARIPTTTCCVDDYLIHSTDSDRFVDRYDIFVSCNVFHCEATIQTIY